MTVIVSETRPSSKLTHYINVLLTVCHTINLSIVIHCGAPLRGIQFEPHTSETIRTLREPRLMTSLAPSAGSHVSGNNALHEWSHLSLYARRVKRTVWNPRPSKNSVGFSPADMEVASNSIHRGPIFCRRPFDGCRAHGHVTNDVTAVGHPMFEFGLPSIFDRACMNPVGRYSRLEVDRTFHAINGRKQSAFRTDIVNDIIGNDVAE